MKRAKRVGISFLAFVVVGMFVSGQAGAGKRLTMGSWKKGSGWHVYSATMANIVNNAKIGVQIDALSKGGGVGNPRNVGTGKYNMALTFSVAAAWGYQGKVAYKKPYGKLRGLIGGLDQYYLGIVTTNPKVNSINDLKNVKVNYVTVPRGGLGQWATCVFQPHIFQCADRHNRLAVGGPDRVAVVGIISSELFRGPAAIDGDFPDSAAPSCTPADIGQPVPIR